MSKGKKLQALESYISLAQQIWAAGGWLIMSVGGISAITGLIASKLPVMEQYSPLSWWLLFMVCFLIGTTLFVLFANWRSVSKKGKPIKTELILEYDGKNFKAITKENIYSYLGVVTDQPDVKSSNPEHHRILQESLHHPSTTRDEIHELIILFDQFLVSPVAGIVFDGQDSVYIARLHYDSRHCIFSVKNPIKGIYRVAVDNG